MLSAKRQQHKKGKGRVNTKAIVNDGRNIPSKHWPTRWGRDLQEKSQKMLEEPLHPRLPACRIPMKNSDTHAAYQRLLSFHSPQHKHQAWQVAERLKNCISELYFTLLCVNEVWEGAIYPTKSLGDVCRYRVDSSFEINVCLGPDYFHL